MASQFVKHNRRALACRTSNTFGIVPAHRMPTFVSMVSTRETPSRYAKAKQQSITATERWLWASVQWLGEVVGSSCEHKHIRLLCRRLVSCSMCRVITLEGQWTTIDTCISILFAKYSLDMKWWRLFASSCRITKSINSTKIPMIILIFIPQCVPSCNHACAKFCVQQFCQMSYECCQFNAGNYIPCRERE